MVDSMCGLSRVCISTFEFLKNRYAAFVFAIEPFDTADQLPGLCKEVGRQSEESLLESFVKERYRTKLLFSPVGGISGRVVLHNATLGSAHNTCFQLRFRGYK